MGGEEKDGVLTVEEEVGDPSKNNLIICYREQNMNVRIRYLWWFCWFPRAIHHGDVRPIILHFFYIDLEKSKGISGYEEVTIDGCYKAPCEPLWVISVLE